MEKRLKKAHLPVIAELGKGQMSVEDFLYFK